MHANVESVSRASDAVWWEYVINYCIMGKLLRGKTCAIGEKYDFIKKTFAECSLLLRQWIPCPQISWRKFFANSYKTARFTKVFSSWEAFHCLWMLQKGTCRSRVWTWLQTCGLRDLWTHVQNQLECFVEWFSCQFWQLIFRYSAAILRWTF